MKGVLDKATPHQTGSPRSLRQWLKPSSSRAHAASPSAQSVPPHSPPPFPMAAPATAHSPRPLKTSSKLSAAFASAFGFGSRASASKHAKQFGHDAVSDPIPQYSLEDDPFAQRYKHSVSPPPPGHPHSALAAAAPGGGRPEFPRSKSDSGQRREHERELPLLPLTPPTATEGAGGSTGNMFQRKRIDSSQYRGKAPAQLLPVGVAHSEPAKKEPARSSWHARSRSSIDMQLPKLARSPRTSDDFSSILDAVANAGSSAKPLPSPASDLQNNALSITPGPHSPSVVRARTASAAVPPARALPPSSPLPSPPTSPPMMTRARSQTVGETAKKRPGAPVTTSPNTLRKLLPTLPPTQSLPPVPVLKTQHSHHERPQSSPTTSHHPNGNGLLGQPRIHTDRPSTAQGLSVATSSHPSPRKERALSPVMPSPTSVLGNAVPDANLQRSMSGRSSSPGLSPRVSSSESSSLLFATVPDSDKSEASSLASNPAVRRLKSPVRPATSDNSYSFPGSGKENSSFARLFNDDTSTPRGSISVIDHSRRTSNASTVHAQHQHPHAPHPPHPLRKSTSQSFLPGTTRHRVDSSTSSALSAVTIKSTVWVGGTTQRPDAPKLIRKQRSLHNVAIPPVPRQVVPQPPTPGTSPTTGPSLLSSWSLKRRSGSRAREVEGQLQGASSSTFLTLVPSRERDREKDEETPLQHATSVKAGRDKANRRPSVTSGGRPASPAISTFFDDTESVHRSSTSHEVSSPKSRRGSGVNFRRGSDIIQHIVPPEELASSWGTASAMVSDVEAKLGDSSSAPSDSSSRLPSKSTPSSPTRRTRPRDEAGSNSMPPSRAVSLIGSSRPEEFQLLSTPVGFGGGLALAPMPPRKPQSLSMGRARGGSFLGEASRQGLLNSLPPPPRTSRRPSLIASSVRSDSALRSNTSGVRGNAALLSAKSRPMSKASTASGGSSIEPATPSGSGPPPVSRKRSILKKPSFLDFENDDAFDSASARVAVQRTKPHQPHLTPPPLTPTQAVPSPPASTARQKTTPTTATAARYDEDSFLDLGRMSFETSQESSDDAPDTVSVDQDASSDFLKWGR